MTGWLDRLILRFRNRHDSAFDKEWAKRCPNGGARLTIAGYDEAAAVKAARRARLRTERGHWWHKPKAKKAAKVLPMRKVAR